MIRRIVSKIYNKLFPSRQKIRKLQSENQNLRNQLEYLKKHSDITKLLPATGKLRELQLTNLKYVTKLIKTLEQEIGIHPWLESGGLLGSIRHGGYIPWDDDLDFGLLREDYEKLIVYCKKQFIWVDTYNVKEKAFLFYDSVIQQHPNEYVAILTPYCLHIYNGTSVEDAGNAEFFVWDYVRDDVSKEAYISYAKNFKNTVSQLHDWNKIYDFYEQEKNNNHIYSAVKTSNITPGIGHFSLAKNNRKFLLSVNDIFPCKTVKFENVEMISFKNPIPYLEGVYGDYMGYPSDLGSSHMLEEIYSNFK